MHSIRQKRKNKLVASIRFRVSLMPQDPRARSAGRPEIPAGRRSGVPPFSFDRRGSSCGGFGRNLGDQLLPASRCRLVLMGHLRYQQLVEQWDQVSAG
jgi:hypothetical protein